VLTPTVISTKHSSYPSYPSQGVLAGAFDD
jgi:hypothetical protein